MQIPSPVSDTLKAVVIARDQNVSDYFSSILRKDCRIDPVADCFSIIEAIGVIARHQPQLALLDLSLCTENGALYPLRRAADPSTVLLPFSSSIPSCDVVGEELQRWVLRPAQGMDLDAVIQSLRQWPRMRPQSLDRFLDALDGKVCLRHAKRIGVKSGRHLVTINIDDITIIETDHRKSLIHTLTSVPITTAVSIAGLSTRLQRSPQFCRISKDKIINLDWVKEVRMRRDASAKILLETDRELVIQGRFLGGLLKVLQNGNHAWSGACDARDGNQGIRSNGYLR